MTRCGARRLDGRRCRQNCCNGLVVCHVHAPDCPVCLQSLSSGMITDLKPCGHMFHSSCIDRWFNHSSSCPCCRQVVKKPRVCVTICESAKVLGDAHIVESLRYLYRRIEFTNTHLTVYYENNLLVFSDSVTAEVVGSLLQ